MSENKPKAVNFNSILLLLVNGLILVTGFFAKHELEKVEQSQQQLWQAIMPRHEIEIELASIKSQQNRCDLELVEVRSKLTTLEISVARLQKP
jgi:hypothetical protein